MRVGRDFILRVWFIALLLHAPCWLRAEVASTVDLGTAEFANNSLPEKVLKAPRTLGATIRSFQGLGLSYSEPLKGRYSGWTALSYSPSEWLVTENDPSAPQTAMGQRRDDLSLMAGVNAKFNPFAMKYWRVLLGAGVGLRSLKYEVTIYRQNCITENVCEITDGRPESLRDRHALAYWRFGVLIEEMRIAGQPAQFVASVNPLLARWPSEIEAPNGVAAMLEDAVTPVLIEFSLEL